MDGSGYCGGASCQRARPKSDPSVSYDKASSSELDDIIEELSMNYDHRACVDNACIGKHAYHEAKDRLLAWSDKRCLEIIGEEYQPRPSPEVGVLIDYLSHDERVANTLKAEQRARLANKSGKLRADES